MKWTIKHIILGFAFIIMFAPLIISVVKPDGFFKLKGAVEVVEDTNFSWKDWFGGAYQKNKEAYLSNSFGGRNIIIRINNQIYYSLFGTIRAKGVLEGKDGYIYEQNYIKSYLGLDFVGQEKIKENIRKLKAVQEVFEKEGKHLLVVIAASKGTYYPEYFPAPYDTMKQTDRNYVHYLESMEEANIPHIDFNQYFLDIRDTTEALLYPKRGTHWSSYGEVLVMDSLLNYFSRVLKKDLPDMKRTWSIERAPIKRDKDLEDGMNIIFEYDKTKMKYQAVEFETEGKYMANVLFIADSFYWGLQNEGFTSKAFDDANFWYYNNSVWPPKEGASYTKDLDFKKEIDKRDVVVILGTEATMTNFGYGAVNQLYDAYVVPRLDSLRSEE